MSFDWNPVTTNRLLCVVFLAWLLLPLVAVAQNYDAFMPGVVKIVSVSPEGKRRIGTGFIVRRDVDAAFIATAWHVVKGDPQPKVSFYSRRHVPATAAVINNDDSIDLSLLIVSGRDSLPDDAIALTLEPDRNLRGGDSVATIGFPAGLGDWAVSRATIGAKRGIRLTLSGAIAEGNSGGPLLHGGKVVAMITSVEGIAGLATPAYILQAGLEGWGVDLAKSNDTSTAPAVESAPEPREPDPVMPDDSGTETTREREMVELPGSDGAGNAESPVDVTPELPKAGATFKDCDDCPEMVVVPASPNNAEIAAAIAVGKFEVTRGQFARFMRETGRKMSDGCTIWEQSRVFGWQPRGKRSWLKPGFSQTDEHPVVCVGWEDATAFAKWLAGKTGRPYRLLSEAEWEYAARAGSTTSQFWGDDKKAACKFAKVKWCGAKGTARVGQFKPNAFGLHDMLGNAWEWVEDCWNASCSERVLRGGSWNNFPASVSADARNWNSPIDVRYIKFPGFRVARPLP